MIPSERILKIVAFSKSGDDVDLIKSAIISNRKLVEMVPLSDDQLNHLSAAAYRRPMSSNDIVILQGDIAANEFFIVASGEFDVSITELA